MSTSFAYPFQALIITLLFIEALRHAARRYDLVDRPNHRKLHGGEIPLVGGLGIFGALLVSAVVVPGLCTAYAFLLVPGALLIVLGLVDDARDLRPDLKLAGQFLVGALTLVLNPDLVLRFNAVPELGWDVLAWITTLLVLVGAMNAVNMMDGVDGLVGGAAGTALLWLYVAAWSAGFDLVAMMALQLLMPVVAFLLFNARLPWRRRPLVFLGDAGSLLLGFGITVLGLQLAGPSRGGWSAWALCYLVALPAIDTASLIVRRLSAGRSPLSADRQHLHHLLQDAGCTPGQVAFGLTVVSALIGGLGLLLDYVHAGTGILVVTLIGLFVLHSVLVAYLLRQIRRNGGTKPRREFRAAAAGEDGIVPVATLQPQHIERRH